MLKFPSIFVCNAFHFGIIVTVKVFRFPPIAICNGIFCKACLLKDIVVNVCKPFLTSISTSFFPVDLHKFPDLNISFSNIFLPFDS